MGGDWGQTTLREAPLEIIDGDRGANYPTQREFFATGRCLFLNAGNVTRNGFDFSECAFVTAEKDEALRKGKLHQFDVVLTTRGTVGNAAYFDESVPFDQIRINSGMVIFRADAKRLDPRYLYLLVRSDLFRGQVSALSTGSAQPQLPIRDINRIVIPLPEVAEQRAIAHILGTLDDKIELNRRMNETLEAIARALFKSWFVDFDPVHAKAEGRDPGLQLHLAALFPDRFEDSELGEIPAGWRVSTVKEVATLSRQTISPTAFPSEAFDHYSIPAFDERRWPAKELGSAIKSNKAVVSEVGVLLSKLNPRIRRVWLPHVDITRRSICSTEFLVLTPKPVSARSFLYCLLTSDVFADQFSTFVTGTSGSHQRVRPEALMGMRIISPPTRLIEAFSDGVRAFFTRGQATGAQALTLAELRDALLPKLISGELRVRGSSAVRTVS